LAAGVAVVVTVGVVALCFFLAFKYGDIS